MKKRAALKAKQREQAEAAQPVEDPVPPKPEFIGIENFDRKSRNVRFTEAATLEALKRLGYVQSEFNFKARRDFAKHTDDEKVIDLIAARFERKRNEMIEKVVQMRKRVLEEKEKEKPMPPILRREKMRIENEKLWITQIEKETQATLKKLALAKFRTIAKREMDAAKSARTIQRFKEIDEAHGKTMRIAKERSSMPMQSRKPPETERPIDYIDEALAAHLKRAEEHLESVRSKWKATAAARQRQIANARERSTKLDEEKQAKLAKSREAEEERFATWTEKHIKHMQQIADDARTRSCTDALEKRAEREKEAKEKALKELTEREQRHTTQIETCERTLRQKLADRAKQIKERAATARTNKEAIDAKTLEQRRKQLEDDANAYLERQTRLQRKEALHQMNRKCELDERVENAKHILASAHYLAEMKAKELQEDMSAAEGIAKEGAALATQKTGAKLRFKHAKKRLNRELNAMESLNDTEHVQRIQAILNLSDDDMSKLLALAREPTGVVRPQRPNNAHY